VNEPATARRLRLLLVEDNPADVRLAQEVFREGSIHPEIDVACDGVEALEFLRRHLAPSPRRPDLVLLDLNLPRMDGREVLKEMSADPALASIPVIVLTTSDAPRDVSHCLEQGAMRVYSKPIDLASFRRVVQTIEQDWMAERTRRNGTRSD
jgi:CheY-like chemotaxis protein